LPMVLNTSVTEYNQTMSIRTGIVTTSMVWNGVRLNYTVFAHRTRPTLGIVQLEITPLNGDVNVTITDMLDGAGSWRTTFNDSSVDATMHQLITSVQPNGISNVFRSRDVTDRRLLEWKYPIWTSHLQTGVHQI